MNLDLGRKCRLLDMRDQCYVKESLDRERIRIFQRKIEEYKKEGYEVTTYELIVEIMRIKIERNSLEKKI